jgi:PAS domain S-box-containing protein
LVWVALADGEIEFVNRRWADFTGLDVNACADGKWIEAVHTGDRAAVAEAWRSSLTTGESLDVQCRVRHREQGFRWFLMRAAATFENGRPVRWLGTHTDIHDLKTAESALQRANEESERAGRTKDEFLSVISHDLRTPLSAILGWTQLLEMDVLDDAERREAVETIKQQAKAQSQLIEDLLDVSRIVNGKFHLRHQPVELGRVLSAAFHTVLPIAASNGIGLNRGEWDDGVVVHGDPQRLQQVATNLLTNAVKYTPQGGHVELAISVADGTARVRVRDSGMGIPVDQIEAIFERFTRVGDAAMKDKGGLGLGLAIVKHVVDAHGGTVCARSDGPGKGSLFELTLPAVAASAAASPSDVPSLDLAPDETQLLGVRILVIDDEESARTVIAAALRKSGCDVVGGRSVQEAWTLLNQQPFDVLVSDLGLMGETGLDLIARVRSSQVPFRNIPALALTGFASVDDQTRALAAGFQQHVAKPFEPTDLVRRVLTVLRASRARA